MQQTNHAKVVPSFFAKFLRKDLICRIGNVSPSELLCWVRPGPLSDKSSQELRQQAIRRLRPRFDPIWESEIAIPVKEGWLNLLTPSERSAINEVFKDSPADRFQHLTLRELKKKMAIPVEQVLSILARIEAVDWNPNIVGITVPDWAMKSRHDLSDEAREEAKRVANLEWVKELKPTDIRFPCLDGESLSNQILNELRLPQVQAWVAPTVEKLTRAMAMTVCEEIHDVGIATANVAKRRRANEVKAKFASVFASRYASKSRQSLQDVGAEFGLTRERIRQMCDELVQVAQTRTVKLPTLEKLLTDVAALRSISEEDINTRFADQLGGIGIENSIDFAHEIGIKNIKVRHVDVNSRVEDRYVTVSMFESTNDEPWMQFALSFVSKDCSLMGCTNLFRIAGLLSIKHGVAPGQNSLESLIQQVPGYRCLDPKAGWFTTTAGERSAAASRLQKMLYVAQEPVNVDTIAEAFITACSWLDREDDRAFAFPPVHVLRNLFSGWDWITTIQHNRFSPREPILKNVLSETERILVEVIDSLGGVALRQEIAMGLMCEPYALTSAAVSSMLANTPIVEKVEHGIYRLRGRRLNLHAIAIARSRGESFRGIESVHFVPGQPIAVAIRQSSSDISAIRRVVYLPTNHIDHIQGVFLHASGVYEKLKVMNNGQIRRLSAIAEGLGILKKEMFELTFDLDKRTYEIRKLPSTPVKDRYNAQPAT